MSHDTTKALAAMNPTLIGANLPYWQWLAQNAQAVPTLSADIQDVINAASIDARWAAVKKLGDDLLPIADSFPKLTAGMGTAANQQDVELLKAGPLGKIGDGHLINILIQNGPAIIAIIKTIIGMFSPIPVPAA